MKRGSRQKKGAMRYPPYWFKWGRITDKAWNDMPMDMRKLVPEQFVIHLLRLVDCGRDFSHSVDLFDQLTTFVGCQLE
jgi:hypothetical protein